ncbi:MAG: sulfatase [Polyangiaceae bacterium]
MRPEARRFVAAVTLPLLVTGMVACDRTTPPAPGAPTVSTVPNSGPVASTSASAAAEPVASGSAAPAVTAQPSAAPSKPLNVVLITIDSLRADMPWAGYPRAIAPRLTELESKSISYTNAYALSSYTSMSVGGFLAGEYPGAVKRDGYFFGSYPKDVLMFPERLQAAGIRTMGAFAHKYFTPKAAGFEQGFDVYKLVEGLKWDATTDPNVTAPKHEALAEEILGDPANTGKQFFAWFHFMDPHDQYVQHKETQEWGKKARDHYDSEVEYTDQHLGKLFDFITKQPWGENTAIVISADHGESFGEHNVYRHGFELYQNLIRVPWFFYVPGAKAKRIDVPRSHVDMAPTILELMGVKADPPLRGTSRKAEIFGEKEPDACDVIVDLPRTSDNDRRRALISGKYKVIAFGDDSSFQVFDIEADPEEKRNLAKHDKETAKKMIDKYLAMRGSIKDVHATVCRKLKGAPEGRDY